MKKYNSQQKGLIKMIIIIVIAIAILSWYGVDIKEFFTSPQVQKNFGYVFMSRRIKKRLSAKWKNLSALKILLVF